MLVPARRRRIGWGVGLAGLILVTTACGGAPDRSPSAAAPVSSPSNRLPSLAASPVNGSTRAETVPITPPPSPSSTSPSSTSPSSTPAPSTPPPPTPSSTVVTTPTGSAPVIVLDPGHSPSIQSTDPATGLNDSDYENEPEMRDVFDVAELVKARLTADGYRVVMTKNSATDRISLGQRAAVANRAHAALALSIHDQAGANGGILFSEGNNIVYSQSVGDYRTTPNGTRITFTDAAEAATSLRYSQIFQAQRSAVEGHSVRLQRDTGYDLGSRDLPGGDIWMVQLLSKVPWVYNEAGGNSPGLSGLNATDKQRYANGLVASIEQCVPIPGA